MHMQADISSCPSFAGIDLKKIEKRKSVFEFMMRQLEVIEEQAYLCGQESVGKSIFGVIQQLEQIERDLNPETAISTDTGDGDE